MALPSLLTPYSTTPTGIAVARFASTGEPREHLVTSFAQVTMGETYWSLLVENGPEHYLRPRDLVAVERAFRRDRLSLGGRTFRHPAETPERAVAEVLVALRAPAIEAFVPRLASAMERALLEKSEQVVATFLVKDPAHRDALAWVAQSIVGRRGDEVFVSDTAEPAFGALFPANTRFELLAQTSDMGVPEVVLVAERDGVVVRVFFDALGRVAVGNAQRFAMVEMPAIAFDVADEARHLATTSDGDGALERLERALALAPDDSEIAEHVGATYAMLGDNETALELLDRAARERTLDPWASFTRAMARVMNGDVEDALPDLDAAIPKLFGDQKLLARHNRAVVAGQLGDAERRIALEKENTEEFPDDAPTWYSYGLALVQTGHYDASIAATRHFLETFDADDAKAHYSIACAYALRAGTGDDEKALEHVERAIASDPDVREDIAADSDFDRLKDDERFVALVGE